LIYRGHQPHHRRRHLLPLSDSLLITIWNGHSRAQSVLTYFERPCRSTNLMRSTCHPPPHQLARMPPWSMNWPSSPDPANHGRRAWRTQGDKFSSRLCEGSRTSPLFNRRNRPTCSDRAEMLGPHTSRNPNLLIILADNRRKNPEPGPRQAIKDKPSDTGRAMFGQHSPSPWAHPSPLPHLFKMSPCHTRWQTHAGPSTNCTRSAPGPLYGAIHERWTPPFPCIACPDPSYGCPCDDAVITTKLDTRPSSAAGLGEMALFWPIEGLSRLRLLNSSSF